MSSVALEDFKETLDVLGRTPKFTAVLTPARIRRVLACAGETGDCSEWTGWFFLELVNGDIALLTGGCDTSGWGCQDWVDAHLFGSIRDEALLSLDRTSITRVILALGRILANEGTTQVPAGEWDFEPVDLNRWLAQRARLSE